ncbi:STAS domain-containing protein, partial [Thermophilibacter provencensis]
MDIAIFNVEGDLDVRSVPATRRRLDALVAQGTRRIFMNMGDVSYVDSAGMGFILGELRRIR